MRKLCIIFIFIFGCVQPFDMKSCLSSDDEEEGISQQSNLVDVDDVQAGPRNSVEPRDSTGSSRSHDDSEYAPLQDQQAVGAIRPADIGGCMACISCFFDCLGDLM